MNRGRLPGCVIVALVLTLLVGNTVMPLPLAGVEIAQAASGGLNAIVGLFRIGAAWGERNRVYREAGATAEEINAYYDSLIAQAKSTRADFIAGSAKGERPARLAAAYTRVEAALGAERNAAIRMIEAEKNQARRDFNRKLGKEIANILIASPGGQQIIAKVRGAVKGAREAAVAVQVATEKGRPIEALRDALAKQVGDIPLVQEAARELGSAVGHGIDRALGGVIGKAEKAIDDIQGSMGEAIDVLDALDASVAQYDGQERRPVSLVEDSRLVGKIIPVDRANAVLDVAASAYAGAAALSGALQPATTRADMRDRIRDALLGERLGGIRDRISGNPAGQTYCLAVGRGEYEVAARSLGQTPQTSGDPERAAYLVCYDTQTQAPQYARMLGSEEVTEEAVSPTAEEGAATIPADTYVGTTNWLQAADPSWSPENYVTNELTIHVAVDGTVSGSYSVLYNAKFYNEPEDCSGRWEYTISGVFSGQLTDAQGTIDVAENFATEIYTDCPDRGSGYAVPISRKLDVRISGDQMTGATQPLAEDSGGKFAWSFDAAKQ